MTLLRLFWISFIPHDNTAPISCISFVWSDITVPFLCISCLSRDITVSFLCQLFSAWWQGTIYCISLYIARHNGAFSWNPLITVWHDMAVHFLHIGCINPSTYIISISFVWRDMTVHFLCFSSLSHDITVSFLYWLYSAWKHGTISCTSYDGGTWLCLFCISCQSRDITVSFLPAFFCMTTRYYFLHQLCIACHHYAFFLQLLITLQLSFLDICLPLDITAHFLCIICLRCDITLPFLCISCLSGDISSLLDFLYISFTAFYIFCSLCHFCPSSDGRRTSQRLFCFLTPCRQCDFSLYLLSDRMTSLKYFCKASTKSKLRTEDWNKK